MILQFIFIPMIAIGSIVPNLIIILLVYYTLSYGQLLGTILGAFYGFIFDIISGGILGSAMFSITIAGFAAGYFYNENKIEFNIKTMFFILIVFISSSVNSFFYLLLTSSEIKLTTSYLVFESGILPGIYTSAISIPFVIYNKNKK